MSRILSAPLLVLMVALFSGGLSLSSVQAQQPALTLGAAGLRDPLAPHTVSGMRWVPLSSGP